jgi:hypothetical protein
MKSSSIYKIGPLAAALMLLPSDNLIAQEQTKVLYPISPENEKKLEELSKERADIKAKAQVRIARGEILKENTAWYLENKQKLSDAEMDEQIRLKSAGIVIAVINEKPMKKGQELIDKLVALVDLYNGSVFQSEIIKIAFGEQLIGSLLNKEFIDHKDADRMRKLKEVKLVSIPVNPSRLVARNPQSAK